MSTRTYILSSRFQLHPIIFKYCISIQTGLFQKKSFKKISHFLVGMELAVQFQKKFTDYDFQIAPNPKQQKMMQVRIRTTTSNNKITSINNHIHNAKHRLFTATKKKQILPRNLTWNLKIMVFKWTFLFQGLIFRFHVKFRGCTYKK